MILDAEMEEEMDGFKRQFKRESASKARVEVPGGGNANANAWLCVSYSFTPGCTFQSLIAV